MADQVQSDPKKPLLDLDTLITRPTVAIHGAVHELRSPDELSVLEYQRIMSMARRADVLEHLADPTDEDVAEYERLGQAMCRRVLLASDEVHNGLLPPERALIIVTFVELRLGTSLGPAGEMTTTAAETPSGDPSTGASSSLG